MVDRRSPNDSEQALAYARQQGRNPSQNWRGYCQKFVRSCYAIPSLYASAYAQWVALDDENRHRGSDPDKAPVGAALFSKGSSPYGHIWLAAKPFRNGDSGSWSTDIAKVGQVDKCDRDAPMTQWNHRYLGWSDEVNGYDLRLNSRKPAVPKQDKPYEAIQTAINAMEAALENAKKDKDAKDIDFFKSEIHQLKQKYDVLRHT